MLFFLDTVKIRNQSDIRRSCCNYLNPHLPSGPVHPYQLDKSISNFRGVWCTFSFLFYFEQIFLLANGEDPDQTLRSAASDMGLHCLPISMSQKQEARLTVYG